MAFYGLTDCVIPPWIYEELRKRAMLPSIHRNIMPKYADKMGNRRHEDVDFLVSLKECAKVRNLDKGVRLHFEIVKRGLLQENPYLASSIINMYVKCGVLAKAQEVLRDISVQDVVSWNALIAGYAQHGQCQNAFDTFRQLKNNGLSPVMVTFISILKVCGKTGDIDQGREIYREIVCQGLLQDDVTLGTALVDMYAKCGSFGEAQSVLRELSMRNVVSWNALISGYSQHGQCDKAFDCIQLMEAEGLSPNTVTFVCILKVCGSERDREKGKQIHQEILRRGLLVKDNVLANALVDMYAKCGLLPKAKNIIEELCIRDIVAWNSLIAGLAQQGQGHEALKCFEQMQTENLSPNAVTFTCILKACSSTGDIHKGIQIHEEIVNRGYLENDIVLGNALVEMYAKCGALAKAQAMLEVLPIRNVVSWSLLVAGHVQQGQGHEALDCFERIQSEGLSIDIVTYICTLKACGMIGAIDKGKQIHHAIVCRGLVQKGNSLGNALVDMYAKCGILIEAKKVLKELPVRDVVSWNALIAGYAHHGDGHEALNSLQEMQNEGLSPDVVTFICSLKACASVKAIEKGKEIHEMIENESMLEGGTVLGAALVDMYAKCGELTKAEQVFESLQVQDVFSWNALISGCAQQGKNHEAFNLFERMQNEGVCPNSVTFICALGACSVTRILRQGRKIHAEITKRGLLPNDVALGNSLVDMYAKCGTLGEAQIILEKCPSKDRVSWNALVTGYAQQGRGHEALNCFEMMQKAGIAPDVVTFVCILKACGMTAITDKGRQIHNEITRRGLLDGDIILGNALVDMYVKFSMLDRAQQLLEELPIRNTISWNILIAGYAQNNRGDEALNCYERMQCEGFSANVVTFLFILKACAMVGKIEKGKYIHNEIVRRELIQKEIVLGNALVDMYSKCSMLAKAKQVFDDLKVSDRNVVAWNALISGCAQQGQNHEVLEYFTEMQNEGHSPDIVTFIYILQVCGNIGNANEGIRIHDDIMCRGLLEKDTALGNALVDMYARCGLLEKAQQMLENLPNRDIVSWNVLIAGHTQQGQGQEALDCFEWMQSEGFSPDSVTFICALKACGNTGCLNKGRQIHDEIVSRGLLEKDDLLGAALVDMYAKCGVLAKAQAVLEELPIRCVVSWNVLLAEYAQQGQCHEALSCFDQMLSERLSLDVPTLICVLKACGSMSALGMGKRIHDEILSRGLLHKDIVLATALLDMYCKCGLLEKAKQVLEEIPVRDAVSWSALIAGYAHQGQGYEAFSCYKQMQTEGFSPDEVTFLSLLNACSHSGLMEEAQSLLGNMSRIYGIIPSLEHLTCILVVFGYAGQFDKAMSVIKAMPSSDYPEIWLALLGACKKWGNVKFGKFAFQQTVNLDSTCSAAYVLMENIFAAAGMQEEAERIESLRIKYASGNRVDSIYA